MSDYLGNLLNKESVLEWLLSPDHAEYTLQQIDMYKHIRRLSDVVELRNLIRDGRTGRLKCEIGEETLGLSKSSFIYLSKCGDVLPRKLIQEVCQCPACSQAFTTEDVIVLNPKSSEIARLEQRLCNLTKNGISHSGKPLSRKKRKTAVTLAKEPKCKKTKRY
ncbi:uncharacterized protein Ecym_8149 [Eremothecium cymbalariae DBVPG|uniref:Replication termination factor 2 n=1 Tax=Eremothecium cymbalariae (strain CBS 270.75 / DBVPG 7215 / KCTC 17166 / NRRL Y-17582) TaxID=931890 RepID=G8JX63_ERECY|nr:Hypothetical protein Ecym_8149 [Eremothecium cymbalariae DBVPG\